jgi:hypothetical protein
MLNEELRTQKASPYNTRKVESNRSVVGEHFQRQSFYFLLGYIVLLHFYPTDEKHFCYLYLDLQDHILKNHDSFWLSVLLENKDIFLLWLEEQKTITEDAFFGNIVNQDRLIDIMNSITIVFEERLRRPKRVIRHRGYRDKGSLPKDSQGVIREEESKDIFLSILQYQIEEKSELRRLECELLRKHYLEERKLSDEQLIKFKILKRKDIKKNERKVSPEDRKE